MAEAGSGVPAGCREPTVEKPEDEADVGPLVLPSTMVKLSDLECPLASLTPPAELMRGCGDGRPFARDGPSCGVVLLPIGVANCSRGGVGREEGRGGCVKGARSGTELLPATGFWLGDGGIASPRRGVLAPPPPRLPPGMGGRRRGAGEDIALDLSTSSGWLGSADMTECLGRAKLKTKIMVQMLSGFLRLVMGFGLSGSTRELQE